MTAVELSGCALGSLEALALGILGYAEWGWLGSLGGVCSGFLAGWFVGVGLVSVTDWLGIRLERNARRRDLKQQFGDYWSAGQALAWNRLLEHLDLGDPISGIVVRKHYYGVFLDAGVGFPALLTKLHTDSSTSAKGPEVGAEVLARVARFDHKEHIVELTQGNETE